VTMSLARFFYWPIRADLYGGKRNQSKPRGLASLQESGMFWKQASENKFTYTVKKT